MGDKAEAARQAAMAAQIWQEEARPRERTARATRTLGEVPAICPGGP